MTTICSKFPVLLNLKAKVSSLMQKALATSVASSTTRAIPHSQLSKSNRTAMSTFPTFVSSLIATYRKESS